jgi:hypothetical protein
MIAVLADGSVRPVSYTIDFNVYVSLLYRNDGRAVELP